jgi:hypothetical protein
VPTSRDLYLFVAQLSRDHRESSRTLEEYLRALHVLGRNHRRAAALTYGTFVTMLGEAFGADVPEFDKRVEQRDLRADGTTGFDAWERTVLSQILDLQSLTRDGVFQNELRYFGVPVNRPRRAKRATASYWTNLDPLTFLECGCVGAFGGWEPGDDTGRVLVAGDVAVLTPDGSIAHVPAEEIEDPVVDLSVIGWDGFVELLTFGQLYE